MTGYLQPQRSEFVSPYPHIYQNTPSQLSSYGLVRILYVSHSNQEVDIYCDSVVIASNVLHGHVIDYLEIQPGLHELKIFNSSVNREQLVVRQLFEVLPNKQITLCLLNHSEQFEIFSIIDEIYPKHNEIVKLRFINLRNKVEKIPYQIGTQSEWISLLPTQLTNYLGYENLAQIEPIVKNSSMFMKGETYSLYLIEDILLRGRNQLVLKDCIK